MNHFKEEPPYMDKNKHIMNVVFSLNRACNLRCHHCCLSNEYKANKDSMPIQYLERYFEMVEDWIKRHKHEIDMITLLMSGAEISMLSDEKFIEYGDKIYEFYKHVSKTYPEVIFEMLTLSNLVDISEAKKNWIKFNYQRALSENLPYIMATSYEKYTNRFSKPEILKRWEKNVAWFNENDIPMVLVWSISKQDALDAANILKYIKSLNVKLIYVPILPTGESIRNKEVVADYEDFEYFLRTVYNTPNIEDLMMSQKRPYDYDKVVNLILEQNGFVFMDLLQDLVLQYEKSKDFNVNNQYINDENKAIFTITNNDDDFKAMDKFWNAYMKQEKMYRLKSGCYHCEFFDYCAGGVHTFRPVYHTKDKCPGFKNFLKDMSARDQNS